MIIGLAIRQLFECALPVPCVSVDAMRSVTDRLTFIKVAASDGKVFYDSGHHYFSVTCLYDSYPSRPFLKHLEGKASDVIDGETPSQTIASIVG